MLTLIALNGQDKGRSFQLNGEKPELLGRQAPVIRLTDAQTSRKHAEVILQNNTWLIRDLDSTNGTWVNGQKISHITELEIGDRIVIGRHQFRVSQITHLPSPRPQPKAPQPGPALGNEELADMGVDLTENLSADLLDDDEAQELSKPPDAVIEDELVLSQSSSTAPSHAEDDEHALIDLDALLADDKLTAPQATPPVEPAQEQAVQQPVETEPDADHALADQDKAIAQDGVIDLDAILGDDAAAPQADAILEPEPDTTEPTSPPDAMDDLDLDADVDAAQKNVTSAPASEDVADESVDLPPATGASDVDFDLDELLSDASSDHDAPAEDSGLSDAIREAQAIEPSATDEVDEADEPASDTTPTSTTSDSLIDIDILASAKSMPVDEDESEDVLEDILSEATRIETPTEPETPTPDAIDQALDVLSAELDEPSDSDSPDEPEPLSEDDSAVAIEPAILDELSEDDKALLMSPDEQAQAVSGYRRSRLMTLAILLLCLAAAVTAGWYGMNYFINIADATSRPVNNPVTEPTRPVESSPANANATMHPSNAPAQPKPPSTTTDADNPFVPVENNVKPPANSNPLLQPYIEKSDAPTPIEETAPGDSPPSTPDNTSGLDAFEDVNLAYDVPLNAPSATDAPDEAADPAELSNPIESPMTAPATPQHEIDASSSDNPATPDEAQDLVSNTNAPKAEIIPPAPGPTNAKPGDLELLTGMIDAQHAPPDRANDQAEFADAHKIVYVVDASGSLVDSFPRVLAELDRVISELPDEQAFTVVFFGSDGILEIPPVGLRWANHQTTRDVREWIAPEAGNVNAWGRGDPLKALQQAVRYQPDEIVILSDNLIGRQATQDDVDNLLSRIAALVDGHNVKVNVIQFFDRDPLQVLKRIAEQFKGTYHHVIASPSPSAQTAVDDPLLDH